MPFVQGFQKRNRTIFCRIHTERANRSCKTYADLFPVFGFTDQRISSFFHTELFYQDFSEVCGHDALLLQKELPRKRGLVSLFYIPFLQKQEAHSGTAEQAVPFTMLRKCRISEKKIRSLSEILLLK